MKRFWSFLILDMTIYTLAKHFMGFETAVFVAVVTILAHVQTMDRD